MSGRLFTAVTLLLLATTVNAAQTPAPQGASVYIISPANGETVASPFKVRFGLTGMGVAPAGTDVSETGHHHLLIDTTPMLHGPIPKDEHHLHFGNGQTETELSLPPGKHTLQLLLGDKDHVPHKPAIVSREIIIYVTE